MLNLRIENLGDITLVHCVGRMVFPYNREFRIRLLQQLQTRTLVLEFVDTIAIDASGLGLLVSLRTWATQTGRALKLMNVTPRLEQLLEMTRLNREFEICSAREMLDLLCRALHQSEQTVSPARLYPRPVECPRISHKREADNGANRTSSTSQSSACHHNSAVMVELTSTMGTELDIHLTCSTRSVQFPSAKVRSATMAALSVADASKSVAVLMPFAHSTLRPRRCKSCSIIASGFLALTKMTAFTASLLSLDIWCTRTEASPVLARIDVSGRKFPRYIS